ncbi:DUF3408 domain-containing protein [Pedobacter agri]|uniref:DUF3408 domain-containing protein n=1 Tax=Pedobacter agri TaxID=454586 RepID=UPI002930D104|nr:DUF3408 domain-containing protein [Pedobacter agri]
MEKDRSKRNIPKIDEELMMEMMKDGVQKDGFMQSPALTPDKEESDVRQRNAEEKLRAKKTTERDYEHIFFKRSETNARDGKTVYIRPDFHEKLSRIVQVIGEDKLTIYAYLDNLLAFHFEEFGEQITKSFNEKYKPIL